MDESRNEVKLLKSVFNSLPGLNVLRASFPALLRFIVSSLGRCEVWERANDGWRHFDLQFQILAYIEHWTANISSLAPAISPVSPSVTQCHPAHLSWEPWARNIYEGRQRLHIIGPISHQPASVTRASSSHFPTKKSLVQYKLIAS